MRNTGVKRFAMMGMIALLGFAVQAQAIGTGDLSRISGWYPAGTNLSVYATPGANSEFDTWLGDTNGASITDVTNLSITVNSPLSITGRFSHITHDIVASAGAGGSISLPGTNSVDQGTDKSFTITSSNHYTIADVNVDTVSKGAISGYTFSNVMASHTIDATFAINQYTITFASDGGSGVSPITQDYDSTVTAPADPTKTGYTFNSWSPLVPAKIPGSNLTCTAQWDINQYTITFDTGSGSAVTAISQNYDTSVTAPANPTRVGYNFTGWTPSIPSPMPASNTTCVAQWEIKQYSVTYIAGANGSVTGTPSQTIDHGNDATTVGAVASNGYHFVNWSDLSTSNPRTDVNVTNAISVTANFAINEYTFEVISEHGTGDPVVGVTTNDWNTGLTASIVDSPETNGLTRYVCTGWTATGSAPASGTDTNLSFTITNNTTVTWQWQTNYWVDFTIIGN